MEIQLVIFDLAGTTVKDLDFVPQALVNAFSNKGISIPISEARKVMGIPKPVAIGRLLDQVFASEETDPKLVEIVHKNFLEEIIRFYKTSPDVEETEGVSETFRILKSRNIKVGIDTGFDRQTTDVLLSRLSWLEEGLVDVVVTSDEVEKGRPHPDMIFRIMEIAQVKDATSVVKVGDTESDLLEGNAAGCAMTIGVTTGAYSEEQLRVLPHSYLIKSIPQLLDCLEIHQKHFVEKE